MDKVYNHKQHEDKIYKLWEKGGYFKPEINPKGKPYCTIMPPPNANEALHIGHARFLAIEDMLIRFARMQGKAALWLPGTDHAGIETQYVFEQKLEKEGKSRFDYNRKTLYQMIWDYVQNFKGVAVGQMKKLGASADWDREKFTLDPDIVQEVYKTFKKLAKDGLTYRAERLVNFCTRCGTSYSELEVDYKEKEDYLYTLDYGLVKIATTRPETIFADVAVAVNQKDKRYKKIIGANAQIPLINTNIPVIADSAVDPEFGTGALKITPAHDKVDFEIGQRYNLPLIQIIDETGRLTAHPRVPEKYQSLTIKKARELVVESLKQSGKLVSQKPLKHAVGVCYRCKNPIESMLSVQWFIKTRIMADKALAAVAKGQTKIPVKRFEKIYTNWLGGLQDWNISRQIVWGIPIPVWYKIHDEAQFYVWFVNKSGKHHQGPLDRVLADFRLDEVEKGLTRIKAPADATWCFQDNKKPGEKYLPEVDTFDTWFSSGQWPFITLKTTKKGDFDKFYPTDVMETGYDILPIWVVRMMMLGIYATSQVPFKNVMLHGLVRDARGEKISKSKGNVVNPLEMAEKYGTDALRISLIWGALIENDIALSEGDIKGQRNFANKIWNIANFVLAQNTQQTTKESGKHPNDTWIQKELDAAIKEATTAIEKYRLSEGAATIYNFIWKKFADIYIEKSKSRREEAQPCLEYVLDCSLRLLHPFMPFVTEAIWQIAREKWKGERGEFFKEEALIIAPWPKAT